MEPATGRSRGEVGGVVLLAVAHGGGTEQVSVSSSVKRGLTEKDKFLTLLGEPNMTVL